MAPMTTEETFTISGVTEAQYGLRDVYIFINNDKVFFRAWQPEAVSGTVTEGEAAAADGPAPLRLPFEVSLPLQEGANSVVIFARKSDELHARHQMVVFRVPEGSAFESTAENAANGDEEAPVDGEGSPAPDDPSRTQR